MYDIDTAELIRQVPQLKDLDVERLPQQLTEIYAEIVAMRMTLHKEDVTEQVLYKIRQRLRNLANTYGSSLL